MTSTLKQPLPMAPGSTKNISWDWGSQRLQSGDSIATWNLIPDSGVTLTNQAIAGNIISCDATLASTASIGSQLGVNCWVTTTQIGGNGEPWKYLLIASVPGGLWG